MTAGNDVVDLSKWNGTLSVNIGDAFSGDNDKVTVRADALAGLVAKDNLKLTSIENLEIVNSDERNPVILKGANFKGLEVVKLIGDATTLDVSSFTQGVKIDATANADTITGSDKADTINGGAGNDIITGNDGNDVLTGGNGADEFVVGTVKAAGIDQILDFSAEDKITMKGFSAQELKKFDASTFSTVTYKTLDSVLATFRSGGANVTKDGDFVIFSYDGKTYALLANGAGFREDNDALVDITGANVASLTESNFGISGAFANYADFKAAVGSGEVTTDSPTTIKSITVNEAAALLTTDKSYLAYIDNDGIGAVTGGLVDVAMNDPKLDATEFADKLATSVVLNITGVTAGGNNITSPFAGSITGGTEADTINASAATDAVTINGGGGDDKITGGAGSDTINANSGTDSVTGGKGADTITVTNGTTIVQNVGDSAGSVTLAALSSGITAVTVGDKVSGATTGLKVDLSSISTAWTIYQTAAVATKADLTNYATAGFDAFILTDSTNSKGYLVYETDAGNGTTAFGNLEVIEVGADDTFTNLVDNNGILSLSS